MKLITKNRIFVTYFVILGLTALAGAALAFHAYQCPSFAAKLREIPTWIGTFFGALIAIIGAFIVAAWRHDKENKEKIENLATLMGNENNYFMTNLKLTSDAIFNYADKSIDSHIYNLSAGNIIFNDEQKFKINRILPIIYNNDIELIYRKDISIFSPETMNNIIHFFEHVKHLKKLLKELDLQSDETRIELIRFFEIITETELIFKTTQESLKILSTTLPITETHFEKHRTSIERLGLTN